jgi:hypothetical protein
MGSLGRHCLRAAAVASACVLLAALGAGLVRLLPWLLAAEIPWTVATPFAAALAAVALETAVLVGVPIGFAFGAAVFVERGEARALMALGASPLRLVASSHLRLVVVAGLSFMSLVTCDVDARDPGRIAAQLIEQGKSSCEGAVAPRSAVVPMVGVTWLCFPGRPPRVVGTLPKLGDRAWFTASELRPSEDLRTFGLEDLRLVTRARGSMPTVRLRVDRAVVSGLQPWGRPAKLPTPIRALLLCAASVLLSLLVAWLVIVGQVASRVVAAALAVLPTLGSLHALHHVDGGASRPVAYLWVPAAGAVTALLCFAVFAAAVRLFRQRRGSLTGHVARGSTR